MILPLFQKLEFLGSYTSRATALNMPNQNKGTFPSDTQKNPKDCMAIQLRSGKDLSSNKKIEGEEETEAEKGKTEEKEEKNSQLDQLKRGNDQKKKEGVLLQCHSHRDFRSQREKNSFLNSWIFSRK